MNDPEGSATGGGMPVPRRVLWIAIGLAAAAAAAWAAPAPWPEGPGRLEVAIRGERAEDFGVPVGGRKTLDLPGVRMGIRLPSGISTDAPLSIALRPYGAAGGAAPALADLQVTLVLPDGRREMVPVTKKSEDGAEFLAERRPPVHAAEVLGILALVLVLWVTEAGPLFVPALAVPVALVALGVAPAKEALAPFFDPVIALFFAGFLMAEAMRRVGLDAFAARALVASCGRSPGTLFAGLVGTSAFLSLWMSNTAAAALVLPVALAVGTPLGDGFRRAAVLGVAYAATVGGTACLVGTPANLFATRFLGEFAGRPVTFAGWFAWGFPFAALLLPIMGLLLWRMQGVAVDPAAFGEARRRAAEEGRLAGRLGGEQWTVLGVFVAVVALWVTEQLHGVDPGIVALGGAAVLAALGKIRTGDLGRISWEALLVFGGGIALGLAVVRSGASDWIATRLAGLSGLPPMASTGIVAALTLLVTAFASNTASAAMMIPLMLPLAGVLGTDPAVLVVVAALASSVDFALVIGTPPTMMAYATGLFSARDIFRAGILLDLAGLVLLTVALPWIWRLLGVA